MLTDEQKREVALIASVGCDLETAARYVGCPVEQIEETLTKDAAFAEQLRRAEAGCEVSHMRCVQQASRDEKHWRASVWWLERRLPERYARRESGSIGQRELTRFLGAIAGGLAATVRCEEDRERLMEKLNELSGQLVGPGAAPRAQEQADASVAKGGKG